MNGSRARVEEAIKRSKDPKDWWERVPKRETFSRGEFLEMVRKVKQELAQSENRIS